MSRIGNILPPLAVLIIQPLRHGGNQFFELQFQLECVPPFWSVAETTTFGVNLHKWGCPKDHTDDVVDYSF